MPSFTGSRTSERPTLPSIHSLNLPFMSRPTYDSYEKTPSSFFSAPRKASSSSSNTSMSRSPSPVSPFAREASPADSAASTSSRKLRLVPCPFEEADAVIVVPAASPSATAKPIMLVGSAMQHLRGPQRSLTKGARMHPYRIVGTTSGSVSRRSSMASMISLPGA